MDTAQILPPSSHRRRPSLAGLIMSGSSYTSTTTIHTLPLEIVERIVGSYGAKWGRRPDPTLLSCLSTSSQFRACALRRICEDIPITLTDEPQRLNRLRECMTPSRVNSRLGGIAPYIKSISIAFSAMESASHECDEDIVLPLLNALLSEASPLRISLRGHAVPRRIRGPNPNPGPFDWNDLPSRVRRAIFALVHIRNVSSLSVHGVDYLPEDIFMENRHLSKIDVNQCDNIEGRLANPPHTLNIKDLALYPARFPHFRLPKLQRFTTRHHSPVHRAFGWKIIKEACETLEHIEVQDLEARSMHEIQPNISVGINLTMFPNLEAFGYTYYGTSWSSCFPLLSKALHFLESETTSSFAYLMISLCLAGGIDASDDFWDDRAVAVAADPSWATLDGIEAGGNLKGCSW